MRSDGDDDDEIGRLLELVNLDGDAARRKFRACSTGMKQRLGIAATLLGNPNLLILDEPTNGLDPAGIIEVRELIRSLASGADTGCGATPHGDFGEPSVERSGTGLRPRRRDGAG